MKWKPFAEAPNRPTKKEFKNVKDTRSSRLNIDH